MDHMKFNGNGKKLFGITAIVCILALAGCQSYHPKPLTQSVIKKALAVPGWQQLRISAKRIHGIGMPPLPLHPNGGLTPDEAAVIAVILNPSLRIARDQRGEAAAQVIQAGILPNPQLSDSAAFVTGGYRTNTFTGYGVGLNWDVTRLIDRDARVAAAKYHCGQVDLEVAWQEWQTAQAARLAVYNLAATHAQLHQARLAEGELQTNEQVVEKAYNASLNTILDLTAARAARQQAEALVQSLAQKCDQDNIRLRQIMGLPLNASIRLSQKIGFPAHIALPPRRAILKDLSRLRLDLVALKLGYKSQDESLRAAILRQFPRVSLGFQQASDTTNVHTTGFGVSIDLPIFDRNQGQIAIQKATRQMLYDTYIAREFDARSAVALAYSDIHALGAQIAATQAAVKSLAKLVATYQQALKFGNVDIVSYYTEVDQLIQKRMNLIQLKNQLERNHIALALAAGTYVPELDASQTRPTQGEYHP
ncbi:MAG: TolC family protein [Phycisphaerae bacterium]